jgi:hypothetical protein
MTDTLEDGNTPLTIAKKTRSEKHIEIAKRMQERRKEIFAQQKEDKIVVVEENETDSEDDKLLPVVEENETDSEDDKPLPLPPPSSRSLKIQQNRKSIVKTHTHTHTQPQTPKPQSFRPAGFFCD